MSILVLKKCPFHIPPSSINVDGVKQLLGSLGVQKSTSPDCIPACLLKESSTKFVPAPTHISITRPHTN